MNIVIIEDEAISVMFLTDVLTTLGHTVVGTFSSARNFLNSLEELSIDLLLLDIKIKGEESGLDIAKKIKEKNIPILFITSYKDSDTIKRAAEFSPLGYLIKPIDEHDLEAAITMAKSSIKNTHNYIHLTEEFKYSLKEKILYKQNYPFSLGEKELLCLDLLAKNFNKHISRESLIAYIWQGEIDTHRISSLRELISRLKTKIPNIKIENLSRIGYSLKD